MFVAVAPGEDFVGAWKMGVVDPPYIFSMGWGKTPSTL